MPQSFFRVLLAAASLGATGAAPAGELSASSAISNSIGASSNSISRSSEHSSNASSPGRHVRAGRYEIRQMAAAPGREGDLRLSLREAGGQDDEEVVLFLPQRTVARAGLQVGQVIVARARPYGFELAQESTRQAFFLLLQDDRYRELETRAVTL